LDFHGETNGKVLVCFSPSLPSHTGKMVCFRGTQGAHANRRPPLGSFRCRYLLLYIFLCSLLHHSLPPRISSQTVQLSSVPCSRPQKTSSAMMSELAALNVCFAFRLGVFLFLAVIRYFVGDFGRHSYECA
jgi:hypothetical protein